MGVGRRPGGGVKFSSSGGVRGGKIFRPSRGVRGVKNRGKIRINHTQTTSVSSKDSQNLGLARSRHLHLINTRCFFFHFLATLTLNKFSLLTFWPIPIHWGLHAQFYQKSSLLWDVLIFIGSGNHVSTVRQQLGPTRKIDTSLFLPSLAKVGGRIFSQRLCLVCKSQFCKNSKQFSASEKYCEACLKIESAFNASSNPVRFTDIPKLTDKNSNRTEMSISYFTDKLPKRPEVSKPNMERHQQSVKKACLG